MVVDYWKQFPWDSFTADCRTVWFLLPIAWKVVLAWSAYPRVFPKHLLIGVADVSWQFEILCFTVLKWLSMFVWSIIYKQLHRSVFWDVVWVRRPFSLFTIKHGFCFGEDFKQMLVQSLILNIFYLIWRHTESYKIARIDYFFLSSPSSVLTTTCRTNLESVSFWLQHT